MNTFVAPVKVKDVEYPKHDWEIFYVTKDSEHPLGFNFITKETYKILNDSEPTWNLPVIESETIDPNLSDDEKIKHVISQLETSYNCSLKKGRTLWMNPNFVHVELFKSPERFIHILKELDIDWFVCKNTSYFDNLSRMSNYDDMIIFFRVPYKNNAGQVDYIFSFVKLNKTYPLPEEYFQNKKRDYIYHGEDHFFKETIKRVCSLYTEPDSSGNEVKYVDCYDGKNVVSIHRPLKSLNEEEIVRDAYKIYLMFSLYIDYTEKEEPGKYYLQIFILQDFNPSTKFKVITVETTKDLLQLVISATIKKIRSTADLLSTDWTTIEIANSLKDECDEMREAYYNLLKGITLLKLPSNFEDFLKDKKEE